MPLTDAQIRHFEEEGYLVLPDLLPVEASAPLRQELTDIVEFEARRFHAAGKVPDTFDAAPFDKRLVKLCEAADDPQELKEAVTGGKRMKTESVFKLWTHPVLPGRGGTAHRPGDPRPPPVRPALEDGLPGALPHHRRRHLPPGRRFPPGRIRAHPHGQLLDAPGGRDRGHGRHPVRPRQPQVGDPEPGARTDYRRGALQPRGRG